MELTVAKNIAAGRALPMIVPSAPPLTKIKWKARVAAVLQRTEEAEAAVREASAVALEAGKRISAAQAALNEARAACDAIFKQTPGIGRAGDIIREIGILHQVSPADIIGPLREKEIAIARFEAIWRVRKETTLSLPQIGRIFNRDHTTIIASLRSFARKMRKAAVP